MNSTRKYVTIGIVGVVAVVLLYGTILPTLNNISIEKTSNNTLPTSSPSQTKAEIDPAEPKIDTKTEIKREAIKYDTKTINDSTLEYGKTKVQNPGSYGEITYTYKITYENGKEVARELISKETTKEPVSQIVAKGTKVLWYCVDATSYDKNPYNDNKCTSSTGEILYVSDSQSRILDPSYSPGKSGHPYYNSK